MLTTKQVNKPYFTLKRAQNESRIIASTLTDDKLQKHIVKLADYKFYIQLPDTEMLIQGGYFRGVVDPGATGIAPADIWLYTNIIYALDEALKERELRRVKNDNNKTSQ
jgi:hypothetical protein